MSNSIRMPEYAVDRKQARKLFYKRFVKKSDVITLDLRDTTFAGVSFASEVGKQLLKLRPSRIIILGGNEFLRNHIAQPLMKLKVPIKMQAINGV